MESPNVPSLIINIAAYIGIAGCASFVILEVAKQSVEYNLIKCAALRAYSAVLQGSDISYEGLKQIYKGEMKKLTGVSGGLTKEEAWWIILSIKEITNKDTTIENTKRQWIIRSAQRAIPEHYPGSKSEYIFALVILGIFLYGLNNLARLIASVNFSLREALTQSALVIGPCLIIFIVTFLMTKWAIRSTRYKIWLEKSTLKK